jgi:hypothetical protein
MLRPSVNRPICLAVRHTCGAQEQILITVTQLRVCLYGASSITRGRVCRLQLLLALASAVILGSESRFTVSYSRLPQPGGPGPRIYIPQEHGGPVMSPGIWFPFHHLLRLAGLQWRYSNPSPRGNSETQSKIQSYFTTGGLPPINSSWRQAP